MKRGIVLSLAGILCMGAALPALHRFAPEEPPLSRFVPQGALLYLEAKDFSPLLGRWNGSAEKEQWLKSGNYEVFSRSRLFLRLGEARDQFAAAAGLPADRKLVSQVAGKQSALALYDIGKLQFLYLTKIGPAGAAQSTLWQSRAKFETRTAGGVTFYLRKDPESEREVAFAVAGDYLLLATREDLMAGALQLLAGGNMQSIESETWWKRSTAAAGQAGDLRMALNLEKIVPSPYFRSYWIQNNITDLKQYSAAVSDLFLASGEYREERVLIKKSAGNEEGADENGAAAVADVAKLVPPDAGFYQALANPTAQEALALLETKLLAPHRGAGVASQIAPQVQLGSGETGGRGDLETRIDQAPLETRGNTEGAGLLKNLLEQNRVRASLQVQSSEAEKDGVFVRFHSAVVLLAVNDWQAESAKKAVAEFVRPAMTASRLGFGWQPKQGTEVLDGLWPLSLAVRGKFLMISDSPETLAAMAAQVKQKASQKPAVLVAEFQHARERERFSRMMGLLDSQSPGDNNRQGSPPQFFSGNISSLSATLSGVSSEKVIVRDAGDKVLQTVTYEWER